MKIKKSKKLKKGKAVCCEASPEVHLTFRHYRNLGLLFSATVSIAALVLGLLVAKDFQIPRFCLAGFSANFVLFILTECFLFLGYQKQSQAHFSNGSSDYLNNQANVWFTRADNCIAATGLVFVFSLILVFTLSLLYHGM